MFTILKSHFISSSFAYERWRLTEDWKRMRQNVIMRDFEELSKLETPQNIEREAFECGRNINSLLQLASSRSLQIDKVFTALFSVFLINNRKSGVA